MSKNIALKILEHPDKDEIISKLVSGVSCPDIHEWLAAKYINVGEKKFILSDKVISSFNKDYLDIYSIIREDLSKTKIQKMSPEEELKMEIQGNPAYHKALEAYVDNEVDIKIIAKRLAAAVEARAAQVFDLIQEDPRNIKMDRTLIEWFNTLLMITEKFEAIQTGTPDQINIQNNINIQIVDEHINVVYNIIKEILAKLDYDTSLLFIEMFNEAMKDLKVSREKMVPVDVRLEEAQLIENTLAVKLEKE
jgi:hypothetical protein